MQTNNTNNKTSMKTKSNLSTSILALLCAATTASADIGYQFVNVGNEGNANDSSTGSLYGGVSYNYSIGKYDVTLNQYTAFLNVVAQTDTYGLYNGNMGTNANIIGISRSGVSGSYSYAVIGDGQCPVTYVSWFDAARMANWMHNGQPTGLGEVAGSTEQGAYTLNGLTSGNNISKNGNAADWIPTESEWYKAAYYDPFLNAGAGGYWTYATGHTGPESGIGNNYLNPTVANQANYEASGYFAVTQQYGYNPLQNYLTPVGAFTNSASTYGTYDQNGDVWNWNDTAAGDSGRILRGGAWNIVDPRVLQSSFSDFGYDSTVETYNVGFRLATPEPASTVLLLGGGALLALRRRRSPAGA